jgi:hypothetical protein
MAQDDLSFPACAARSFLDASPAAYSALQAASAGSADAVVLEGLEVAGGDVQLVASVLQLQSLARGTARWAELGGASIVATQSVQRGPFVVHALSCCSC